MQICVVMTTSNAANDYKVVNMTIFHFSAIKHIHILWDIILCLGVSPGGWFNIKMPSYQYRKSHRGDKTILGLSYLHNGISHTSKMTSLYWIRAQDIITVSVGTHLTSAAQCMVGGAANESSSDGASRLAYQITLDKPPGGMTRGCLLTTTHDRNPRIYQGLRQGPYFLEKCLVMRPFRRADSRIDTSQWETSLQSNAVSHWLGANLESALLWGKSNSYTFIACSKCRESIEKCLEINNLP